jgi:hypothetical protein
VRKTVEIGLALVLGSALVAPASAERLHSPDETRALLEKPLLQNIVPFWHPGAIDEEHGPGHPGPDDVVLLAPPRHQVRKAGAPRGGAARVPLPEVEDVGQPYIRASSDPEAIALAKELFALLEARAHDEEYGGYLELFPRNWSRDPAEQPQRAPMGPQAFGRKLMNTHLHLMEP